MNDLLRCSLQQCCIVGSQTSAECWPRTEASDLLEMMRFTMSKFIFGAEVVENACISNAQLGCAAALIDAGMPDLETSW